MCVAGEVFPECRECGRNAKFTLQRDIPHVLECALFESGPKAPTRIAERPFGSRRKAQAIDYRIASGVGAANVRSPCPRRLQGWCPKWGERNADLLHQR